MPPTHDDVRQANEAYHAYVAADYEQAHPACFDPSGAVCQRLHRHIDHLAQRHPEGSYLDLGCGTGALLEYARDKFASVTGCDVSLEMLRQSRARQLDVTKGDLAYLPYPSDSFDAVTCVSVLHHLHTPEQALEEMVRVLKPGGSLITDHDPSREFLLKWPKVNKAFRTFFRHEEYVGDVFSAKHGINKEEWDHIEQNAEYHAGPGMNPRMLAAFLRTHGCSEARAEYHFLGDLPLPALKVIEQLGLERGPAVLAPYFSLQATKATG